jgi:hypothetical protein
MNPEVTLGAVERPLDLRDIDLGQVQAPVPRPAVFIEDVSHLPTYYQGQQPACGPHAASWFKARKDSRENNATYSYNPSSYSPEFGWKEVKTFDGYPLDSGTDMRSLFKWLQNIGPCDIGLMPNNVDQSLEAYSDPSTVTPQMLQNASGKKIGPYAFLTDLSFDGVCDAIWQTKEVILLIRCDSGFFRTNTPTFTSPLYGHFVTAFNYDQTYVYIKDSTEKDPALSVKKIHRMYFQPQFIREGGTAVNLHPLVVAVATNKNAIIRQLIALYTMLLKFAPKVATPSQT